MVLATCATATARRLRLLVRPGYFEPTNLWMVTALPPGNRKSAVQAAAAAPLVAWERDEAERLKPEINRRTSERKTAEARANALRSRAAKVEDRSEADEAAREAAEIEADLPEIPASPQLWTSDATPERLGALMAEHGECIAWLSSEGGIFDLLAGRYSNGIPNLDLVLKAWSGDPERVDRGSRPPVYLRSPRLSVALTPQPDVLAGLAAQRGFRGRGLLGRYCYFLPPSPLGYRSLDSDPIPANVREAYVAGVRAMLDWPAEHDEHGEERPHLVRLSTEAHAEWLAFARYVEEEMRPGASFEHVTDWAGKAPGVAARIAAVLHGIVHAHGRPWEHEITAGTMGDALAIMAVAARHSVAALQMMGASPTISAARDVWAWIVRGQIPSLTVRDVHRALRGRFARAAQAREAIDVLAERGYVEVIEPPRDGPGRPASPTVNVRPELREEWE